MGMFDLVEYSAPCPKCGYVNESWQSKSGPCILSTLKPWEVDNFYTACDDCGEWLEYEVTAEVEHIVKKMEIKLIRGNDGETESQGQKNQG